MHFVQLSNEINSRAKLNVSSLKLAEFTTSKIHREQARLHKISLVRVQRQDFTHFNYYIRVTDLKTMMGILGRIFRL